MSSFNVDDSSAPRSSINKAPSTPVLVTTGHCNTNQSNVDLAEGIHRQLGTPTVTAKVTPNESHFYQLTSLVMTLDAKKGIGSRKVTIGNGNCLFDSYVGSYDSSVSLKERQKRINELRMNVYTSMLQKVRSNLKSSNVDIQKTTKTVIVYIKDWITKYHKEIIQTVSSDSTFYFREKYIASYTTKFSDLSDLMVVSLYTHIMSKNRGKFTWPDYDTLCKCEVFDCVVIMIYENERGKSVFIYYPPENYYIGNKDWLSDPKNFKIIVKNGCHFEYIIPSMSFEVGIGTISELKVARINGIIDLVDDVDSVVNFINSENTSTTVVKEVIGKNVEKERKTKKKESSRDNISQQNCVESIDIDKLLQTQKCELLLRFDGACRYNGADRNKLGKKRAGAGAVLYIVINNVSRIIWTSFCPVGVIQGKSEDVTNNIAEYEGLIMGLKFIKSKLSNNHSFKIEGDSQLVINQMNGDSKAKTMKSWYNKAIELVKQIDCPTPIKFSHIPRSENSKADELANWGACSDIPFIPDHFKFEDDDTGRRMSSRKSKPSWKKASIGDNSITGLEAYSLEKDSTLFDRHEKEIDNMGYEYLIDIPTIKENKHNIEIGANINFLQQLFQIDDVIDGSYFNVINNLDEDEKKSRFGSKKCLRLYGKDKLSKELYLLTNNIFSTLIANMCASSNRYSDHLAVFLLPSVLKLILLEIKHKTIISSMESVLRNVLSFICNHESSSLIIVKIFELLYKDADSLRNNGSDGGISSNSATIRHNKKGLYQKVKLLTDEGQYGRAFKEITQSRNNNTPIIADDELDDMVKKYFPEKNSFKYNCDDDFGSSDDVKDLDISAVDVLKCVKSLNISSAPGVDAWSYKFLKDLILHGYNKEESQSQIVEAIILAVNSFYKAHFCKESHQLWSTTRLVFIPKYSGDVVTGWRPIGITSALYRLFGKIISFKIKETVSKLLCSNNQLGIGIPDGCSIGATLINRYLHVNKEVNSRERAILQNDISNAFNETSHSLIEKGLALICPDLIHVFRFIYSNNPLLMCNNRYVGRLFTGTLQGDALSMIFFNVAFHIVLLDIKEKLPLISMVAYCDDLTVLTYQDCIDEDSQIIWESMERHGFRVNKDKCKKVSMNDDTTILGMPIGSPEYVNESFKLIVEDMRYKVSMINSKLIKSKSRLIFLKVCINTIPTYFIRLISLTQNQYDEVDSVIDEGLKHIVGRSIVNGYSQFIRGLSQHLGGLGIHRYGTGFGQILHDILQIRTNQFIIDHRMEDVIPVTLCNRSNISLDSLGLQDDSDTSNSRIRHQRILKNVVNSLMDTFHSDKYLVANAALLLSSSFKGSAYHITGYRGFNFRLDIHYVHVLSNALLLPICDNHLEVDCFCQGSNTLMGSNCTGYKSGDANRFVKSRPCLFPLSHMFSCHAFTGYWIRCHDLCVKAIMSYIKSINKHAIIVHEPRKAKLLQSSRNTREDLKITFTDNDMVKLALDASIINPAQLNAIEPTLSNVIAREESKNDISISDIRKVTSACSKPFYYTRKVEEDKRHHHIDNLSPGFSIQPFVIESTGNIGPQADKFISYINNFSGVNDVDAATGVRKQLSKEIFLRRRILFFCNLKGAIARENALLLMKPIKIVDECCEFD